jgi:hypothetical protein
MYAICAYMDQEFPKPRSTPFKKTSEIDSRKSAKKMIVQILIGSNIFSRQQRSNEANMNIQAASKSFSNTK